MKQMRIMDINYWTTVIDQRDENKFKDDIYFRKALSLITEWIKDTMTLKIKPKNLFERTFNKLTTPPNEEDPFKAVFS